MHYFTKLKNVMNDSPPSDWRFMQAFPYIAPDSSGVGPLTPARWNRLSKAMNLKTKADYLKHVLTLHDGEARCVGAPGWKDFSASGGEQHKACYWDYQYVKNPEVRKYLYERSQETCAEEDLSHEELWWCMEKENFETSVLAWIGPTSWLIRIGSFVSLNELFQYGNKVCTCYDMYCLYLTLPIFIHKEAH